MRITFVPEHRTAELRAMSYSAYLRTPEWRHIRAVALADSDHHCRLCGENDAPLDVHHNRYPDRGAETLADLIVLCDGCHDRHHHAVSDPGRVEVVVHSRALSEPERELVTLSEEILAARRSGNHALADELTRKHIDLWRALAKGRAA